MSESKSLTTPIVEAMQKAGYFCMRLNSGLVKLGGRRIRLCPAGTADIVIFFAGKMPIWVETKVPRDLKRQGETADKQAEFAEKVRRLGHIYVLATSLDQVLSAVRSAQEQLL